MSAPSERERAGRDRAGTSPAGGTGGSPALMLALSTVGFVLTFWAWALLSPLGASLREELGLSSFQ